MTSAGTPHRDQPADHPNCRQPHQVDDAPGSADTSIATAVTDASPASGVTLLILQSRIPLTPALQRAVTVRVSRLTVWVVRSVPRSLRASSGTGGRLCGI